MRSSGVKRRRTRSWLAALAIATTFTIGLRGHAPPQHVGEYSQDEILRGSQIYAAQCAVCHGLTGNNVGTVDLRIGRFRNAVSDDDLKAVIRAGLPATGMPPFPLEDRDLTALVAFIRAGLDAASRSVGVTVGDPARGRAIFETRGNCLSCHRVNGRGSRRAPDLSEIGGTRTPSALRMSLVEPTRAMQPINRSIRAVTADGTVVRGRRLNENTYTVAIIDEREQLRALDKSTLREYEVLTTSEMPSYGDTLTAEERADVLAYLLSLKPPPDPPGDPARRGRGRAGGRGGL